MKPIIILINIFFITIFAACSRSSYSENESYSLPNYNIQTCTKIGNIIEIEFVDSCDIAAFEPLFKKNKLPFLLIINKVKLLHSNNNHLIVTASKIKQLTLIVDYSPDIKFYTAYSETQKKAYSILNQQIAHLSHFHLYNNKWEQYVFDIEKSIKTHQQTVNNNILPQIFKETIYFQKNYNNQNPKIKFCYRDTCNNFVFYSQKIRGVNIICGKVENILIKQKSNQMIVKGKRYMIDNDSCNIETGKYTITTDSVKYISNSDTLLMEPHAFDFVDMQTYPGAYSFDIKYATTDNFTKTILYPCNTCLLRFVAVRALEKANKIIHKNNLRIRFYDCYRPYSVQEKMWSVFPNRVYVANPHTGGSMHNRGIAVDISLTDTLGNLIDMGVPFDYFGIEAHPYYSGFSEKILENRAYLLNAMLQAGFIVSRSEYWHYSLANYSISISNKELPCN